MMALAMGGPLLLNERNRAVDIQMIAEKVAAEVQKAPELAQELLGDPKGVIERITGEKDFDLAEAVQAIVARLADMGVDLSRVDVSKIDLKGIDVSKLNVSQLLEAGGKLGIDTSKLDLAALMGSMGGLGGMLGGFFGRK